MPSGGQNKNYFLLVNKNTALRHDPFTIADSLIIRTIDHFQTGHGGNATRWQLPMHILRLGVFEPGIGSNARRASTSGSRAVSVQDVPQNNQA